MSGSLDYLRWRGDLSFNEHPFNSVDASLFSSLIYLPIDESAEGHTLSEVCKCLAKLPSFQHQMHDETGAEVELIPRSPRLGNVRILNWTNRMSRDPYPLRFTAATFAIDQNTILISYRGTDSSVIGWNEDMIMNYTPHIYGQKVARDYLLKIHKHYPEKKLFLVGHSKGGNFAQYALASVDPALQDQIIMAYSFDGPGFFHEIGGSRGFKRALPKMKTYLPEGSIIGTMLDHPERVLVTKSTVAMISQHDPRRWRVGRDSFVLSNGLSRGARILRHSLIQFNHDIPDSRRGEMWSALFDTFDERNITDMNQLTQHKLLGTVKFSRIIMSLAPDLRKIALKILTNIIATTKNNLPFTNENFPDYPSSNDSKRAPVFFEFYDSAYKK